MNNSQNVSALQTYSGKYFKDLLRKLYLTLALSADGIKVYTGVKNPLNLPKLTVGKGIKPYTGDFLPDKNQLNYTARQLAPVVCQRDILIDPMDYYSKFDDGVLPSSSNPASSAQIPFAQQTWETIMQETSDELVSMLYYGKGQSAFAAYNNSATYSAGALIKFTNTSNSNQLEYYECIASTSAGESPLTTPSKWLWAGAKALTKGYGAIIQDEIDNNGFDNVVTTGTITSDDAYAQFTSVWRAQTEPVKSAGAAIYCSQNSLEYLLDSIEKSVTKNYNLIDGLVYLPKTNQKCLIKPVGWLSGSNRLICTPLNNLSLGTDAMSDMNSMTAEVRHYKLESSLRFMLGLQIADLEVLQINDQA